MFLLHFWPICVYASVCINVAASLPVHSLVSTLWVCMCLNSMRNDCIETNGTNGFCHLPLFCNNNHRGNSTLDIGYNNTNVFDAVIVARIHSAFRLQHICNIWVRCICSTHCQWICKHKIFFALIIIYHYWVTPCFSRCFHFSNPIRCDLSLIHSLLQNEWGWEWVEKKKTCGLCLFNVKHELCIKTE